MFLGETVTVLQGAGYAISLGGFAAYNYLKMQPDAAGADPDSDCCQGVLLVLTAR